MEHIKFPDEEYFHTVVHNSEFKEVKQKGEIIETYWKVTLTKVFDDMKEPTGSTTIEYNTNGESAY